MRTDPMIPLKTTLDEDPRALILRLSGSAGLSDADALEAGINDLIARRPTRVVIDVSELTFITSTSIGHLLALGRAAESVDGRAVIAGARGEVAEALRRCRIEHLIALCPSVEDALHEVNSKQ